MNYAYMFICHVMNTPNPYILTTHITQTEFTVELVKNQNIPFGTLHSTSRTMLDTVT